MKLRLSLSLFILVSISVAAFAQKKLTLFNGKDLSGWKIYGTEKWYVEDGLLVCESGPDKEYGYLGTEQKFKDFELTLEFKQEANGNSGVFFHSSIEGTKISGWQAEVAPPGSSTGGIYESYGRGWLIKPAAEKDKALKMGEWNKMTVKVVGNQVTTYLNGTEMITLNDEKIGGKDGCIALQIHSGGGIKVKWRKIKIKQL
ncbi:MAG: 3-keto-disaccharide hydrolase [Emticicia sp.]|uniref:3-keto-disaccharide hydrolase n=1 Tax=Emticicia sp. TaxID=1930953 RepID=UPI003BA7AC2C